MLNIKTLTDTLSRMQLPQLQQYATLHKNDPYIVTLALSIANQKKQMQAGQAGRAGMQPQPKVADQQIAQMAAPQQEAPTVDAMGNVTGYAGGGYLPEDQGIGTLPAQNMQNFAGGGIVAFDEGGDVPGYQSGAFMGELSPQQIAELYKTDPKLAAEAQTRALRSAVGNAVGKGLKFGTKASLPAMIAGGLFYTDPEQLERFRATEAAKTPEARTAAAQSILNESPEDYALRKVSELEAKGGKKLSPDAKNMAMSQFVKDKIAGQVQRGDASLTTSSQLPAPTNVYTGEKPLPGLTPPGKKPLANAPSADDAHLSGINKLIGSVQTASSVGPIPQFDAKKYSFTPAEFSGMTPEYFANAVTTAMGTDPAKDPFGGQTDELTKAAVATKQNYKTDLAKQFKEQGLAFEGTLKKLTEKEGRINTMEERNTGLALLEAGLSMMSGESPHAMVNIGKGAQVGTKKYAEGMAQIEAARDKVDEAKMKIEEFRRNEANMNAREERAAQKDIDDTLHQGAVLKLAGMRDAFNMNKNQAIASVTNYMQIQQFNVGQKNQAEMHNQSTAAGLDTAYANMANQRTLTANQIASNERIAERARSTQLGIAGLEAEYRKNNPQAGSLGFFREIGKGDPVKGMEIYSKTMGVEAKGDEAMIANYMKNPTALMALETTDPKLAAQIKQRIKMQLLQPVNLPANAPVLP